MPVPTAVLLLGILCAPHAWGQKNKKPENPIEKIESEANFDPNQFAGKWFLVGVASECDYLKESNHRVEATIIQVSPSKAAKGAGSLSVSTFRKLDGICWEIKQEYQQNKAKGKFILKARGYKGQLDVVVGETDHQSYAILYYQRQRKITVKLYARKATVGDDIIRRYEERISKMGIDMEFIYYFPTYGFCEQADQFHILNVLRHPSIKYERKEKLCLLSTRVCIMFQYVLTNSLNGHNV
ncbi:complement component C8 gamma chain isoform X1 [Ascaphus truei]|uniref:complement component C8 gamma chain isoform X1 n=1 Tax=Ascaphus truei TaxID=8439 RepID=UPI003F5A5CA6